MNGTGWDWAVVALLGAGIGSASILSRYRDEPDKALLTLPAFFYMVINALASTVSLLTIRIFGWNFGISDPSSMAWVQVLVAGLGAMTIMRVTLPFKLGDDTISLGINQVLEGVFRAVDQAVDRKRGQERARIVNEKMKDVCFEKSYIALPAYCFALLQSLPQEDQERFARRVTLIRGAETSPRIKSLLLGLSLINLVGDEILSIGVETLGDEIKENSSAKAAAEAEKK